MTLACYAAGQGHDLTRDNAKTVYELCERVGLIGPFDMAPKRTTPPVAAPVPREPGYPPADEVWHLYEHEARDLTEAADAEANMWLMSRKLDPAVIAATDQVRVLPKTATAPSWAMIRGKLWPSTPYRLLAPLWDADGKLCSVHARALTTADPKSANPKGHELAGLVLACPCAQGMLYSRDADRERVRQHGLVICEGLPDWLTAVAQYHGDREAPAVLGIMSGSWTQAHGDKVPDGCRVLIATDQDKDGDRYAAKIAETLARRGHVGLLDVRRWKPPEVTQ